MYTRMDAKLQEGLGQNMVYVLNITKRIGLSTGEYERAKQEQRDHLGC